MTDPIEAPRYRIVGEPADNAIVAGLKSKARVKTEHRLYHYNPRLFCTALTQIPPDVYDDENTLTVPVVGQSWIASDTAEGIMVKSLKGAPPMLPAGGADIWDRVPALIYAGHEILAGGTYLPVMYLVFAGTGGIWKSSDGGETWQDTGYEESSEIYPDSVFVDLDDNHFHRTRKYGRDKPIPLGDGAVACGSYDGSKLHPLMGVDRVTLHEDYDPPLGEDVYSSDEDFIVQYNTFSMQYAWEAQHTVLGGPYTLEYPLGSDTWYDNIYLIHRVFIGWLFVGEAPPQGGNVLAYKTGTGTMSYAPVWTDKSFWGRTNTFVLKTSPVLTTLSEIAEGECYSRYIDVWAPLVVYGNGGSGGSAVHTGATITPDFLTVDLLEVPEFTEDGGSTPNPGYATGFGTNAKAYVTMNTSPSVDNDGTTEITWTNELPQDSYIRIRGMVHYKDYYHSLFPVPYVTGWRSDDWVNGKIKLINWGDTSTNWRKSTEYDITSPTDALQRTVDQDFIKDVYDELIAQSGPAWNAVNDIFLNRNYSGASLQIPSTAAYPENNIGNDIPSATHPYGVRLWYDGTGSMDVGVLCFAIIKWGTPTSSFSCDGVTGIISAGVKGGRGVDIYNDDPDFPDAGDIIPWGWLGKQCLYGIRFSSQTGEYSRFVYSYDLGVTWSDSAEAFINPTGYGRFFNTMPFGPRSAVAIWGNSNFENPYDPPYPYTDYMYITTDGGVTWVLFNTLAWHIIPWSVVSTRRNEFIYIGKPKEVEDSDDWDNLWTEFADIEDRDFTNPNHSNFIRVKCDNAPDPAKIADTVVKFNKVTYSVFKIEGNYIYIQDPSVSPEDRSTDIADMLPSYAPPQIRTDTLLAADYAGLTQIPTQYPPIMGGTSLGHTTQSSVPITVTVGETSYTVKLLGSGTAEENAQLLADFDDNLINLTESIVDPGGATEIVIEYGIMYYARVDYKINYRKLHGYYYRIKEESLTEDVVESSSALIVANDIIDILSIHKVVDETEEYVQPFNYGIDPDDSKKITGTLTAAATYRVRYMGATGAEHKQFCVLPNTATAFAVVDHDDPSYGYNQVMTDIMTLGTMYKHCGEHDHLEEPEAPVSIVYDTE